LAHVPVEVWVIAHQVQVLHTTQQYTVISNVVALDESSDVILEEVSVKALDEALEEEQPELSVQLMYHITDNYLEISKNIELNERRHKNARI